MPTSRRHTASLHEY